MLHKYFNLERNRIVYQLSDRKILKTKTEDFKRTIRLNPLINFYIWKKA